MDVIFGNNVTRYLCYNAVQNIDKKFNPMNRVHQHQRR